MRNFIFLFWLSLVPLFASYSLKDEYKIDQYVVDRLDIPRSFLHSQKFLHMKRRYARYKYRNFFNINRIQTYFIPDLVKLINAQGVPEVFLFMAMAESNFATHARSKKRAVGIWQFMKGTAKKYGLRVDRFVDERRDPYKATNAAIKYLKTLHAMFGKWYLAALAYNAGEGTLQRAIQRAGTDDLMVLIDPKKRYLPKETREYLYKIVMLALMASDKEYRLNSELAYMLTRGEEYDVVPVNVKGGEDLGYVARTIQVQYHYIKELNPHIRKNFTPPNVPKYTIYIPKMKFDQFKKRYTPSKYRPPKQRSARRFFAYKVRSGDSLYGIARRFGVKVARLKRLNRLKNNLIHPGISLKIPVAAKHHRLYRVRKGDNFVKIAKRFGVDVRKLKLWNNKKNNFLKIGERLVVLY